MPRTRGAACRTLLRYRLPMASLTVTIRAATAADLEAVVALLEAEGLPLAGLGGTQLWVAVPGAGLPAVGVIGLEQHDRHGLLRSLAVRDYRRGEGIGSQLVDHVLAEAQRRGLTAVWTITDTAEGFFTSRGFSAVPREQAPDVVSSSSRLWQACPDTAALLRHTPG